MAWNSAKANDAFVNCVGCTMPHGWCCKGNVRPMPGRVLRRGDGCSAANLLRIWSRNGLWAGPSPQCLEGASGDPYASVEPALPWPGCWRSF